MPDTVPDKVRVLQIRWYLIWCKAAVQVELSELFELRLDQWFVSGSPCSLGPGIKVRFTIQFKVLEQPWQDIGNFSLEAEPEFFTTLQLYFAVG